MRLCPDLGPFRGALLFGTGPRCCCSPGLVRAVVALDTGALAPRFLRPNFASPSWCRRSISSWWAMVFGTSEGLSNSRPEENLGFYAASRSNERASG